MAETVPASRVHQDHEDGLAHSAAENGTRRLWIHVEMLRTHLSYRSAGGARAAGARHLVDEKFPQEAADRVAIKPQLSLVHDLLSLPLAQISRF